MQFDGLYRFGFILLAALTLALVMTFVSVWLWPARGLERHFIHVTALNGEVLDIAVDAIEIVQPADDSLHPEALCLIRTTDAQRAVKETCLEIERRIGEAYRLRREQQGQ